MPPNTSAFALRMPPEVKEAARELSNTTIEEASAGDGLTSLDFGESINAALNFLLLRGLQATQDLLQVQFAQAQTDCDRHGAYMTFFLAHPSARYVRPSDLPKSSEPRAWLKKVMDANGESEGLDRTWCSGEYARAQRQIEGLTKTIEAVQRALAAQPM